MFRISKQTNAVNDLAACLYMRISFDNWLNDFGKVVFKGIFNVLTFLLYVNIVPYNTTNKSKGLNK
jgi:hypothetical protein